MSFGVRDEDWIYPDEDGGEELVCHDCRDWEPCPCGCDYGWCRQGEEHTGEYDACCGGCRRVPDDGC